MNARRLALLLGVALLAGGCHATGPGELGVMDPRRFAGCYQVSYPARENGGEGWHFQIDTLPPDTGHRFPAGAMLARRRGQTARHARATYWRLLAANQVEMTISDGFVGAVYHLGLRGGRLVGREQPFTDIIGSTIPAERIAARRVSCDTTVARLQRARREPSDSRS